MISGLAPKPDIPSGARHLKSANTGNYEANLLATREQEVIEAAKNLMDLVILQNVTSRIAAHSSTDQHADARPSTVHPLGETP
jgi:hypothetical protein